MRLVNPIILVSLLWAFMIAPISAAEKKEPLTAANQEKNVILSVINGGEHHFTLAQLQALPQKSIKTTTPWTEGAHTYSGVLLRDLLASLDIKNAKEIDAVALNDYMTTLNASDAMAYDVLLATSEDGKVLTRRNKGPIWVIYPLSDRPELDKPTYHSAMIWQLRTLKVKE